MIMPIFEYRRIVQCRHSLAFRCALMAVYGQNTPSCLQARHFCLHRISFNFRFCACFTQISWLQKSFRVDENFFFLAGCCSSQVEQIYWCNGGRHADKCTTNNHIPMANTENLGEQTTNTMHEYDSHWHAIGWTCCRVINRISMNGNFKRMCDGFGVFFVPNEHTDGLFHILLFRFGIAILINRPFLCNAERIRIVRLCRNERKFSLYREQKTEPRVIIEPNLILDCAHKAREVASHSHCAH